MYKTCKQTNKQAHLLTNLSSAKKCRNTEKILIAVKFTSLLLLCNLPLLWKHCNESKCWVDSLKLEYRWSHILRAKLIKSHHCRQAGMFEDHLRREFLLISYLNYAIFSWTETKTKHPKKPTWKEKITLLSLVFVTQSLKLEKEEKHTRN